MSNIYGGIGGGGSWVGSTLMEKGLAGIAWTLRPDLPGRFSQSTARCVSFWELGLFGSGPRPGRFDSFDTAFGWPPTRGVSFRELALFRGCGAATGRFALRRRFRAPRDPRAFHSGNWVCSAAVAGPRAIRHSTLAFGRPATPRAFHFGNWVCSAAVASTDEEFDTHAGPLVSFRLFWDWFSIGP
jgi:hypothetical protein